MTSQSRSDTGGVTVMAWVSKVGQSGWSSTASPLADGGGGGWIEKETLTQFSGRGDTCKRNVRWGSLSKTDRLTPNRKPLPTTSLAWSPTSQGPVPTYESEYKGQLKKSL